LPKDLGAPRFPPRPTAHWVALIVLFAWVAILRLPSFLSDHLGNDEGLYLTIATRLLAGDWLYTDIWDNKPPGIYLIYALAVTLFGRSQCAVNLISLLAIWATAAVLLSMGARGLPRRTATIAAFALPCFMLDLEGLGANAENFYILFDAVSAAFILKYAESAASSSSALRVALLVGLSQGIAFQIKFLTLFETAGLALVLATLVIRKGAPIRDVMVAAIGGIGAFALPTLLMFALFAGGGHLGDAVFALFVVPRLYVQSPFGLSKGWMTVAYLVRRLSYFAPLFLAAALAIVLAALRRSHRAIWSDAVAWLIAAWLIGAILNALSTGLFSYHYFLAVAPAAALLGGWAADRLLDRVTFKELPAVAVALLCLAAVPVISMIRKETALLVRPPDLSNAMLAAEIRRYASPGSLIFATDQSPIVYALSDTVPATRFPFPYHIFERPALYGVDPDREVRRAFARAPVLVIGSRQLLLEGAGATGALLREQLKDYREVPTADAIQRSGIVFLTRRPGAVSMRLGG
jgi:4-amino-4-deoxy-L-arabinose transferase-like glycosyltransferase